MSITPLTQETYLPEATDQVAEVYDFLAAREAAGLGTPQTRYFLAGAQAGEQVELPTEVYRVLRQVVEAMRQNLAVTVVPQRRTLTTQEAADLLGISRPTVIKLLDESKVAYERVGTHRRIALKDLLAFREQRRREQYAALEDMNPGLNDVGDDVDIDVMLEDLKRVRRTVAGRRRAGSR
ncbi:DNA binding domain-containing protein, excisionase family [Quadrisphaera granulorum]|uniref:Excisionase family DNA binding protein n=1 Tax=Quadrisphaera granulorum TaxID=317664 RepID=A0A316A5V8_9ACTN|nr:helix-turn-helix domain-containing protein [Quadrisphaera granulorum]PWJ45157.1 excisionase family DNA binding protein [Quadrisphaera granulorum]SZE99192.1 DNA binding domain-containing protein, excisionase family [Quadrisphaera granulorum]